MIAGDCHSMEGALGPTHVTDDRMEDGPVVPHQDVTFLPAVPVGELGPGALLVEVAQQGGALGFGHVLEPFRVVRVDEQALATGLGMGADHRMGPHHILLAQA